MIAKFAQSHAEVFRQIANVITLGNYRNLQFRPSHTRSITLGGFNLDTRVIDDDDALDR